MKKIKIISLILILIFLNSFLVGCDNKGKNENNEKIKNEFVENNEAKAIENIELTSSILKDESLLVILKNNNDFDLETLWIEAIFYDKNKEVTGTSKTGFKIIREGKEVAINDFDVPKYFETYEIKLSLGDKNNYKSYTDKISIKSNNTGEKIVITSINESDKDLAILDIAIVYYKEGIPVGFSNETQYNIKKGDTTYFNILYSYDKNYDKVDFDEYKIFIDSAYNEL